MLIRAGIYLFFQCLGLQLTLEATECMALKYSACKGGIEAPTGRRVGAYMQCLYCLLRAIINQPKNERQSESIGMHPKKKRHSAMCASPTTSALDNSIKKPDFFCSSGLMRCGILSVCPRAQSSDTYARTQWNSADSGGDELGGGGNCPLKMEVNFYWDFVGRSGARPD
ncbi:hypothetical protein BX661DRAFT_184010 [Kickxella alabastrina]|uniref:uncharacterized protein n=1 Tax=Kickxella alabastrina TaxID=61397 RepID=UPI00221F0C32|nr:uncharacterized protein BX661DRAFT_184010 [Kickxella alabastrina]KAI7826427.1 hypothetical protein BX661DRAFT_184010 [Kickxella alabastrina]